MRRAFAAASSSILVAGCAAPAMQPLPNDINDVRWNVSSTVFGDFTCRGEQDMAMFGVSERSGFVVMVRPARQDVEPTYLLFATRGRDPKNLRLNIEDLDFEGNKDFKREVEALAPGLRTSKTCKGLSLGDGETDSHHIYWNRQEKIFASWSL